ncbi:hypothetical protein K490DRAFT_52076, partial [Saccharata proteae CBS 121410]
VPRCSNDTALMGLAQLGAVRLNATRAFVSLIDGKNQYVLAEATHDMCLRSDTRHQASQQLWLGHVTMPRNMGVCDQVLICGSEDDGDDKSALILLDPAKNERFSRSFRGNATESAKFYAGVPIRSPKGANIGTFAIFDDNPRDGFSSDELHLMHDMAATVMDYLVNYRIREENKRAEQMLRGLTSFVTGASSTQAKKSPHKRPRSMVRHVTSAIDLGQMTENIVQSPVSKENDTTHEIPSLRPTFSPKAPDLTTPRTPSLRLTLQETMLPMDAKTMFSRAASIIRETTDLEGVVIFDAAIGSFGRDRRDSNKRNPESRSSDSTKPSSDSETRRSPARKMSEILAFATQRGSSLGGDAVAAQFESYAESSLHRLLKRYPNGKIFNVTAAGAASSTEESDGEQQIDSAKSDTNGTKRATSFKDREVRNILRVAPHARSIVFVPLWEYQRERWFAGCLLWTNDPLRVHCSNELLFYRTFGNSIMTELSRLDAIAAERAKTSFVSSISHELRSPLHGILGGVEFLQDTSVDAFQAGMITSIEMCGRTLLDTVEHILDYSRINRLGRHCGSDKLGHKDSRHMWLKERPRGGPGHFRTRTNHVDLGAITEEVVESCLAGQSYTIRPSNANVMEKGKRRLRSLSASSWASSPHERKNIRVILDIPYRTSWIFPTQAGSWRRILLNILGNAVKYTESGFIHVVLQAKNPDAEDEQGDTKVSLIVSDSGIGMHPEFLHNRLYTPFSQADSFAAGTGLGLNIVRQIVDSLGGKISVKSQLGVGTDVKVCCKFTAAEVSDETDSMLDNSNDLFGPVAERLKKLKICIFEPPTQDYDQEGPETPSKGQLKTSSSLAKVLSEWFGADNLEADAHSADMVICTEPSFDFLAQVRAARPGKAPLVVFIALDAMEAVTLRGDSRVTSPASIVEIITQPCGPHKLAKTLHRCLNRSEVNHLAQGPRADVPRLDVDEESNVQDSDMEVDSRSETRRPSHSKLSIRISSTQMPDPDSTTPSPPDHGLRILMVDDNAINMRLLTAFMQKHSLSHEQATNGVQAVTIYQQERGRFDFILMDLSMPVMDGMTATREIRRAERKHGWKPTTVVALTGLASATARGEALSAGIDHFMTKPVRFQLLMQILRGEGVNRERRE